MGAALSGSKNKPTAAEILKREHGDARGKLAIVTGSSEGIGQEVARILALAGAEVWVLGSTQQRATDSCEQIRQNCKQEVKLIPRGVNLSSFREIRAFVTELRQKWKPVHYLVLNAAIQGAPLWRSREGFESHYAVNYLGQVHLCQLLLEKMLASEPARVIIMTCASTLTGGVNRGDPNWKHKMYEPSAAYRNSKLSLTVFGLELSLRTVNSNLTVLMVHPGIAATSLNLFMPGPINQLYAALSRGWTLTVQQAAATPVWACLHKGLEKSSGSYVSDCSVANLPRSFTVPYKQWQQLWDMTQDMIDSAQIDSNNTSYNPANQITQTLYNWYVAPFLYQIGWLKKEAMQQIQHSQTSSFGSQQHRMVPNRSWAPRESQ